MDAKLWKLGVRFAGMIGATVLAAGGCNALLGIDDGSLDLGSSADGAPEAGADTGTPEGAIDATDTGSDTGTCDANLMLDPGNCGACNNACGTQNGTSSCMAGACVFACTPGYMHCGADSTGCSVIPTIDPKNCGGCDHDCLGSPCNAGFCPVTILAQNQASPYRIVGDSNNVYWTNVGTPSLLWADGQVMSLPKGGDGGMPSPISTMGLEPQDIAISGSQLYWADFGNVSSGATGDVERYDIDAGQPAAIIQPSAPSAGGVAADATYVYWSFDTDPNGNVLGSLADGGGPLQYFALNDAFPQGLAVDVEGGTLYWVEDTFNGGVHIANLDGAPPTVVGASYPINVAFDATHACWASSYPLDGGAIYCVAKGILVPTPVLLGLYNPNYVVLAHGYLYWSDRAGGTLSRIPTNGKQADVVVLATGLTNPEGLWVDDANVYWVNAGMDNGPASGTVQRVPR